MNPSAYPLRDRSRSRMHGFLHLGLILFLLALYAGWRYLHRLPIPVEDKREATERRVDDFHPQITPSVAIPVDTPCLPPARVPTFQVADEARATNPRLIDDTYAGMTTVNIRNHSSMAALFSITAKPHADRIRIFIGPGRAGQVKLPSLLYDVELSTGQRLCNMQRGLTNAQTGVVAGGLALVGKEGIDIDLDAQNTTHDVSINYQAWGERGFYASNLTENPTESDVDDGSRKLRVGNGIPTPPAHTDAPHPAPQSARAPVEDSGITSWFSWLKRDEP